MSRKRVVVGTDDRGRPIAAWAKPDVADEPRYGHMQPAFSAPIERRVLTPAQRAWNGPITGARRPAAHPVTTPSPREEPTMPASPPDLAQERTGGPAGADLRFDRLSVAAEAARRAWDDVALAQTAWQVASEDLARAYDEVAWLLDAPTVPRGQIRLATGALATGNTPAQSRANGTAAMLARKAPKAAPKPKGEKVFKRSPETRERMRQAQLARVQRLAEAAAAEASA